MSLKDKYIAMPEPPPGRLPKGPRRPRRWANAFIISAEGTNERLHFPGPAHEAVALIREYCLATGAGFAVYLRRHRYDGRIFSQHTVYRKGGDA